MSGWFEAAGEVLGTVVFLAIILLVVGCTASFLNNFRVVPRELVDRGGHVKLVLTREQFLERFDHKLDPVRKPRSRPKPHVPAAKVHGPTSKKKGKR